MTYVKTQLPTLKTQVVNLKRDAKDFSRDLQRLDVRGKLGSKTLYWPTIYRAGAVVVSTITSYYCIIIAPAGISPTRRNPEEAL